MCSSIYKLNYRALQKSTLYNEDVCFKVNCHNAQCYELLQKKGKKNYYFLKATEMKENVELF